MTVWTAILKKKDMLTSNPRTLDHDVTWKQDHCICNQLGWDHTWPGRAHRERDTQRRLCGYTSRDLRAQQRMRKTASKPGARRSKQETFLSLQREHSPANTLTFYFWPPEPWNNKYLSTSHFVCGTFVSLTLEKWYVPEVAGFASSIWSNPLSTQESHYRVKCLSPLQHIRLADSSRCLQHVFLSWNG